MRPQALAGPLMLAGVMGALLTARVLAAEVPQVLDAVTEMLPLIKVVLLMVVAIVLVVDVPLKPVGSVQLYCVAPVEAAQV